MSHLDIPGYQSEWSAAGATTPDAATIANGYLPALQAYFPPDQVSNALCVLTQEIGNSQASCLAPESCVIDLPNTISCYASQSPGPATANGLFGISDVCWNPALAGTNTPFTPDEWSNVLDPNTNIWMASVIYSIGGWRAWTTCDACAACEIPGEPIPYPRQALPSLPTSYSPGYTATTLYTAVAIAAPIAGLAFLAWWERNH